MTGNSAGAALVEATLRQLGIQNIKRNSRGFTACCPFHNDKNPSFSIMDTGFWQCFGCGVKGNLKQLHENLGSSVGNWRDVCKILGMELGNRDDYGNNIRRKTQKRVNLPDGFSRYSLPAEVPPYIAGRLQWETIAFFQLGYSTSWRFRDRCVIPIRFKGKDVGFHARDLTGKSDLKYLNPTDFDIKDYVFNYDSAVGASELFILEGAFNCMSMWEKGFKSTVATFGTKFTPTQVQHIINLNPDRVILCFDRDPSKMREGKENGRSGQRATLRLGKMLNDVMDVYVMPLPIGRDPNECSTAELQVCYRARVKFETLLAKLNKNAS